MKTIEVTEKAARVIEALRNTEQDNMEVCLETICRAFFTVSDMVIGGDHVKAIPILSILADYYELMQALADKSE